MNSPLKLELLIGILIGLLVSLLIIGLLYNGQSELHSSAVTRPPVIMSPTRNSAMYAISPPVAILPSKDRAMLKPIEMRRIMYNDVKEATDGVVAASDERYMELIRSRMTELDTTRPRALDPPYDKDQGTGQFGQPVLVNERLKGRRSGFYVECGANDGQSSSNSLFFEMEKGWTGILIEPQPKCHADLLRKNRQAYTLNACLSPTGRPQQVKFLPWGGVGGILQEHETNKSVGEPARQYVALLPTIPVMCFPLNDILAAINVTHVDYLSLDIEGLEAEVLETLNWKKLRIDIMTVEFNQNISKLDRLRKLMKTEGYREVGLLGVDVVFEREDLNNE